MIYTAASPILGQGRASADDIDRWFARQGRLMAPDWAPDETYRPAPAGLGQMIVEECRRWSPQVVNHDLVAADIGKESAFWQSEIVREKNNPSGLGAENDDPKNKAIDFETPREGVRATAAHMLTYAIGAGPWASSDPRHANVKRAGWLGIAPTLAGLDGRWADPGIGYGAGVAHLANQLLAFAGITDGGQLMAGDDSRFAWVPDTTEFGYPTKGLRGRNGRPIDFGIIHITDGSDSLGWLNGNNGSSAHYLSDRGMRPRAQMVAEADAAWTAGHAEYNMRGVNFEAEKRSSEPWRREEIATLAETTLPIWKRNNIPLVYLGRDNAGKRGLIGHSDVPDPDGSGWGGAGNHTDPGPSFDWQYYVAELLRLDGTPAPQRPLPTTQDPWRSPHGAYWIPDTFIADINGRPWLDTGYALGGAIMEGGLIVQYFERARLELQPDGTVTRGLVGSEVLELRRQLAALRAAG